LPYLENTWEFVLGEPRPTLAAHIRNSLVEASLATYNLLGPTRKTDLISVLAEIQDLELPDYLRMAIADRKSILLRFKGDHDQSDVVIQDILESIVMDSKDIRSHCAYGRLLLSLTENAILRKEFGEAASYLAIWEVRNSVPSGLELQVVRLKNTVLGRVSRYDGKFQHARYCLEACLQTIPGSASRYHIMHHLGDVYCELGMPEEVEKLVLGDVEHLRARGKQHSKAFRRLALPLAEAYIQQGRLEAAKTVFRELLDIFEGLVTHDVSDQLNHVRSVIGLARVSWYRARWPEAGQILENALALAENYKTFSKGNYYIGIIYLFLSVVNFELHKYPEGRLTLTSANDILYKEVPRHFMPGMGTYFLKDLLRVERSLELSWSSFNETQLSSTFNKAQTT
jgi:tetratricopeptide (TPR) repeat protein